MTWIEVASDAVKIGLGAIIAALSTYFITNKNHHHEERRVYLLQKRDKLDKCIEIINLLHNKYAHYKANVANYYERKRINVEDANNRISSLTQQGEEFRKSFDGINEVEGYLLSVGEEEACLSLIKYRDQLSNARLDLWLGKDDISLKEVSELNEKVLESRKGLLLSINKCFEAPK